VNLKLRNNHAQSGFTLLEVLISMAVLVFISFAIYQATVETYRLRDTLASDGDFYNGIQLSTQIIRRDITSLYSPTMGMPTPSKSAVPPALTVQNGNSALDDPTQTSNFWSPALDATGLRPSRFVGTETKLTFVAISHNRIYKDSAESEFAKITYELKRDEKNSDNPDTMVLTKTENPNAFSTDDIKDPLSHTYEILHGVKKLAYTYYVRDGNTWKTSRSWDSDKEENKNQYPDVIEMNIEVISSKKQIFEGIYKFRPEIPLNGLDPST
jgi:prepilin-type N-terminal cleavage/methylation domain-containing protein